MNSKRTLSVIIPNYNKEKFIEKTILSVENQTLVPDEIIVVDDCSTDNSCEIVRNLQKKYSNIKLFEKEKNSGVSNSRNLGLKLANSEYVTFLDSDDVYWNNFKLENEMNLIANMELKGVKNVCAYSKVVQIDADDIRIVKRKYLKFNYPKGRIRSKLLVWINFATVPRDYCVKKSAIIEVGGYDESKKQFEDLKLLLDLAAKNLFYCTFEEGTGYRQVDNGLSSSKNGSLKLARKKVINEQLEKEIKLKRFIYIALHEIFESFYKIKIKLAHFIHR